MAEATLLLVFHNHQPTGNLDQVFRQTTEDCYAPLVEILGKHPALKFTLHFTGPLWNWLENNRPDVFIDLKTMVDRGQVEMMGGGFYEPMLAILPEQDAVGQLTMMRERISSRFDTEARGMWLAERVWEPDLPRIMADGGYEYTLLDDSHFHSVGLSGELDGYYVTEKAGKAVAIFPISQALRYSIPFMDPEAVIAQIRSLAKAKGGEDVILTYGDDGEKFGVWPGTKSLVWDRQWLERFLTELEKNRDVIQTMTPSEVLSTRSSKGRVYLPTASYVEMGEWSLVPSAQRQYKTLNSLIDTFTLGVDTLRKKHHYETYMTPLLNSLEKLPTGWLDQYIRFMESGGLFLVGGTRKLLGRFEEKLPLAGKLGSLVSIIEELQPVLKGTDIILNISKDMQHLLQETQRIVAMAGENSSELKSFVHGGIWQGFLAKYHESNLIHKRMLQISGRLENLMESRPGIDESLLTQSLDHLYMAQCNCAYWHGIFGGLYMVHLRHALYYHLLFAEHLLDRYEDRTEDTAQSLDYDMDMQAEVILSGPKLNAIIKPNLGGSIVEIDIKERYFNITNVMTRVEEGYHRDLQVRDENATAEETATIHHHVDYVDDHMLAKRIYDFGPRSSFQDYFLDDIGDPAQTLKRFSTRTFRDQGDFAFGHYTISAIDDEIPGATLHRTGQINGQDLSIEKTFELASDVLRVSYTFTNLGDKALVSNFAPESSFTLLADSADDRRILINGVSPEGARGISSAEGTFTGVTSLGMRSDYDGLGFTISWKPEVMVMAYPFHSLSKSEKGVELNYQGTSLTPVFPLNLEPGASATIGFSFSIQLFPPKR
ncbi:DUF1926 domain-containing protein [Myxococcota bacterium]|nr:DUF1926 domain-containing protein [Myxococcota bacterium]MBU1537763.1 DUF1926 domain-containing protein [Myxococcota bacterium]